MVCLLETCERPRSLTRCTRPTTRRSGRIDKLGTAQLKTVGLLLAVPSDAVNCGCSKACAAMLQTYLTEYAFPASEAVRIGKEGGRSELPSTSSRSQRRYCSRQARALLESTGGRSPGNSPVCHSEISRHGRYIQSQLSTHCGNSQIAFAWRRWVS